MSELNQMVGNTNDLKYISTFQGKFEMAGVEGEKGVVTRVNKMDKTVHRLQFNKLTGKLVEVNQKSGEYGARYHFVFDNGEMKAALETSLNSNLASAIINRMPNLDLAKPFEIVARWNISKERALFFINQDGEEVEDFFQAWDKDNKKWVLSHKFPAWEKVTVNGEEKWDSSKQIAYQQKVIAKYMSAIPEAEQLPEEPQPQEEEDEALPF